MFQEGVWGCPSGFAHYVVQNALQNGTLCRFYGAWVLLLDVCGDLGTLACFLLCCVLRAERGVSAPVFIERPCKAVLPKAGAVFYYKTRKRCCTVNRCNRKVLVRLVLC